MAGVSTSKTDAAISLFGGRRLGYAEFGDPNGRPVFFVYSFGYSFGASRLARNPDDDCTAALGVRLITVDRSGIGMSEPQPDQKRLDWTEDVATLADTLEIDRFAVLGWSGDGPHALACAFRLPDRVSALSAPRHP